MEVFLDFPASPWDRLVAVLQEVEPSLVIKASYFLQRMEDHNISDFEFYYYLQLCYQDRYSPMLIRVLHFYLLRQTWVNWLHDLHNSLQSLEKKLEGRCFDYPFVTPLTIPDIVAEKIATRKEAKHPRKNQSRLRESLCDLEDQLKFYCSRLDENSPSDWWPVSAQSVLCDSSSTSWAKSGVTKLTASRKMPLRWVDGPIAPQDVFRTSSTTSSSTLDRGDKNVSASAFSGKPTHCDRRHSLRSDLRSESVSAPDVHSNQSNYMRPYYSDEKISVLQLLLSNDRQSFMEYLNGGEFLAQLLVDVCGIREWLQQDSSKLSHSNDGAGKEGARLDSDARETHNSSPSSKPSERQRHEDYLKRFPTLSNCGERETRKIGGDQRYHSYLRGLNALCAVFLDCCQEGRKDANFFDAKLFYRTSSAVPLQTRHEFEALYRLHWMALILFHLVDENECIIPRPPAVSYILFQGHAENLGWFRNWMISPEFPLPSQLGRVSALAKEEGSEYGEAAFRVASTVSCLPTDTQVEVTFEDGKVQVFRGDKGALSKEASATSMMSFDCSLIQDEVFVYLLQWKAFVPLYVLLKSLVKDWEGNTSWSFGRNVETRSILEELEFSVPEEVTYASGGFAAAPPFRSWYGYNPLLSPPEAHFHSRNSEAGRCSVFPCHSFYNSELSGIVEPKKTFDLTVHRTKARIMSEPLSQKRQKEDELCRNEEKTFPKILTEIPISSLTNPEKKGTEPLFNHCILKNAELGVAVPPESDKNICKCAGPKEDRSYSSVENDSLERRMGDFSANILLENKGSKIQLFSHRIRIRGDMIGKGAFGAVFKALDLETGETVAVKQSSYRYEQQKGMLNWQELELWSMLPPHPNVIRLHGASVDERTQQVLLVLEYASGGNIKSLYQSFAPLTASLLLKHARGIALGLSHLHNHHVRHADVKPENVLTRSDGSVAISDFGCSRVQYQLHLEGSSRIMTKNSGEGLSECEQMAPDEYIDETEENRSAVLAGTVAYMAPEVALSKPLLASDVWAYTCTLLCLWTGEEPWSRSWKPSHLDHDLSYAGSNVVALLFYIGTCEDALPYIPEQINMAPEWLQKIAGRTLVRDANKRCTMREVLSILSAWE